MVSSDAQIENALAGRFGAVSTKFHVNRLNSSRAYMGDVSEAFVNGRLELNNRRLTVRTIQFTMRPEFLPADFDRLQDLLQVYFDLYVPETDEWVSFSQGIFRLDAPTERYSPVGQTEWSVRGTDLGIQLLEQNHPTIYTVALNESPVAAALGVFEGLGLPAIIPGTALITPSIFVWPPATSYATIVTELLVGANYYPPWVDTNGIWRSRERIDPVSETPAVRYGTDAEPRMVVGEAAWTRTPQTGRFTNRAVVATEDVARAPASVEAVNNDALSRISVVNTGITQTEEINGDRACDQTTMIAIARYTLLDADGRSTIGALETFSDPRRDAHEVYRLKIEDVENESVWRVGSWTLDLKPGGRQQHKLELAQALTLDTAVLV